MAQISVDPPPQNIPEKFKLDPQLAPYFTYLNKFNRDMWLRSGAGLDILSGSAVLEADQEFSGDNTFSGSVNFDGIVLQIDGIPVLGPQAAAVADAAAATATNPSPPSPYSAPTTGAVAVTSGAADDFEEAALALQLAVNDMANYELTISALIVDVADMRSKLNSLLAKLRTHGIIDT